MKIGLDLDNTLIDYRRAIYAASHATLGLSIPDTASKEAMKEHVISARGKQAWTELQGRIYGDFSRYSSLYPGLKAWLTLVSSRSLDVIVVSHKTELPILGEPYRLREFALENMERLGLFAVSSPISGGEVYFCDTKPLKIEAIVDRGVDFFIDDLPEILAALPSNIAKAHIHCASFHPQLEDVVCCATWSEVGLPN